MDIHISAQPHTVVIRDHIAGQGLGSDTMAILIACAAVVTIVRTA